MNEMNKFSDEALLKWLDTHIELRKQLFKHSRGMVMVAFENDVLVYYPQNFIRLCKLLKLTPTVDRLFPNDADDLTIVATIEYHGYKIKSFSCTGKEFYDYVESISD